MCQLQWRLLLGGQRFNMCYVLGWQLLCDWRVCMQRVCSDYVFRVGFVGLCELSHWLFVYGRRHSVHCERGLL